MKLLTSFITIPSNLWGNIIPTGSNYICDPPVNNTDIDFLIYSKKALELCDWLLLNGFESNYADYVLDEIGSFQSFKKDTLNLIVVDSYEMFQAFYEATELAKKLNLLEKEQRINLFQYILYHNL